MTITENDIKPFFKPLVWFKTGDQKAEVAKVRLFKDERLYISIMRNVGEREQWLIEASISGSFAWNIMTTETLEEAKELAEVTYQSYILDLFDFSQETLFRNVHDSKTTQKVS